MQVKEQQLDPDMEQQTGSKLGKEYKAVYCHPAYLTCIQAIYACVSLVAQSHLTLCRIHHAKYWAG